MLIRVFYACFFLSVQFALVGQDNLYFNRSLQDFASKMQSELIREIEKANPRYAVIVNINNSWTPRTNSDRTIFRWAEAYFGGAFRIAGLVDILPDGNYKAYWDEEARKATPQSESNLYVVERIGE